MKVAHGYDNSTRSTVTTFYYNGISSSYRLSVGK